MQINPYLFYNGDCEAAFKFYEKVLGAEIELMLTHEGAPASMPIPPEWKLKIMHGRLSIDGAIIMGSDAPPGRFRQSQGFAVSLLVENPGEAERRFEEALGVTAEPLRSPLAAPGENNAGLLGYLRSIARNN